MADQIVFPIAKSEFFSRLIQMLSNRGFVHFSAHIGLRAYYYLTITSTKNFNIRLNFEFAYGRIWRCRIDLNSNCQVVPIPRFSRDVFISDEVMTLQLEFIQEFLEKADKLAMKPINSVISKMIIFESATKANVIHRPIVFLIANIFVTLLDQENFGFRFRIPD